MAPALPADTRTPSGGCGEPGVRGTGPRSDKSARNSIKKSFRKLPFVPMHMAAVRQIPRPAEMTGLSQAPAGEVRKGRVRSASNFYGGCGNARTEPFYVCGFDARRDVRGVRRDERLGRRGQRRRGGLPV